MKMEHISQTDLMKAYLATNYSGKYTLVMNTDACDSIEELLTVYNDLAEAGFAIPNTMKLPGWLIIEMNDGIAKHIINEHAKGFVHMVLYHGGEPVHENW